MQREVARSAGGRDVDPPHPRCSSVGGDAHIAPHTAPAVSFRASDRRHWRGNPFPAPAGAEHPPPEGVSKEGGPQPSLFGRFKERGFLRGEGNRNPSPLKWRFWVLLSLLTKVTRRRQKRKSERKTNGRGRTPPLHSVYRNPVRHMFRGDVGIAPYGMTTDNRA